MSIDGLYRNLVSNKNNEHQHLAHDRCHVKSTVPLFVASISFWGEFDHCVQWNLDVRQIDLGEVMEVCVSIKSDIDQ